MSNLKELNDDIVEDTPELWNNSWEYKGPQHIRKKLKDPNFTYGWVNFKDSGRVDAAIASGWEVDTAIKASSSKGFDLPGHGPETPIEGALILGSSLLVRKLKKVADLQYQAEQNRIVEPVAATKNKLKQDLINLGIPSERIDEFIKGGVDTKQLDKPLT